MSAIELIGTAQKLSRAVSGLSFSAPVTHVYNPLDYAWACHEQYLRRYGEGRKRIVFVGMNPGPFGMTQIGVPFGEIAAARDNFCAVTINSIALISFFLLDFQKLS